MMSCRNVANWGTRRVTTKVKFSGINSECECNEDQKKLLQIAAAFHGFHHGDFVGVFEIGADGNADADARNTNSESLDELREIRGS
jgi:hypothetical protein